jgi:hypothetical protein
MTVMHYLNLRYRYEEIVRRYKIPDFAKHGTREGMIWFVDNSTKSNRFRKHHDEAVGIANEVLNEIRRSKRVFSRRITRSD